MFIDGWVNYLNLDLVLLKTLKLYEWFKWRFGEIIGMLKIENENLNKTLTNKNIEKRNLK